MNRVHDIQSVKAGEDSLHIEVDGQAYRIRWANCSSKLESAAPAERERIGVSPSGYGLNWPLIDEDLAVTPLLQVAETMSPASA